MKHFSVLSFLVISILSSANVHSKMVSCIETAIVLNNNTDVITSETNDANKMNSTRFNFDKMEVSFLSADKWRSVSLLKINENIFREVTQRDTGIYVFNSNRTNATYTNSGDTNSTVITYVCK